MQFKTILISAILGFSVVLLSDVRIETRIDRAGQQSTQVSLGTGEAFAGRDEVRRTARRTSRRTSRRVSRRHATLPHGCPLAGAYYYCGGVYYQPVVENGTTVYVIVTP